MIEDRPQQVVVIGAGIGGLTAGALLAQKGYRVTVLEQAAIVGGCASTFRRRGFSFDVGATQVAGLEPGGIHQRIFEQLEIPLPEATPCDPACAVYLPGESEPISVWRDAQRWQQERQRQFPGSEPFWQLLKRLFEASWRFQGRDPVLPPRSLWDVGQLVQALRPDTLITLPYTFATVGDALRQFGLDQDLRLRRFLDLQLKLYSQVEAEETALLYAATALAVSQAPQGLSHLVGSMQVLGDRLIQGLQRWGGELRLRQRVEGIQIESGRVVGVQVRDCPPGTGNANRPSGQVSILAADHVVANVTVQNLLPLLGETVSQIPSLRGYQRRVEKLPLASGAFVIYLGVSQAAVPPGCPPHLQFLYDPEGAIAENNSLFVSVSRPGDGRAPEGQATIIASTFTDVQRWWRTENYEAMKQQYTQGAIARLGQFFDLRPEHLLHVEAGTPRTFARFTARDQGVVGGVGMRLSTFGPFGFANRTPVPGLWLVGDSTHPGEGTAGVSYSALTVARQIVGSCIRERWVW